jgi:hypothetical protein
MPATCTSAIWATRYNPVKYNLTKPLPFRKGFDLYPVMDGKEIVSPIPNPIQTSFRNMSYCTKESYKLFMIST